MNELEKLEKRKKSTRHILITVSVLFLFLMLVLPLLCIIASSLKEGFAFYMQSIRTDYVKSALKVTLIATVAAVVINTFFGLCVSWLLTKFSFRGKQVLATLIDIPFSISPVIVGLAFLMTFGRLGWTYPFIRAINQFFGTNIRIAFAIPGVILATVFVTFPYVSREVIPVLNAQGKDEEEAAALMGAGGLKIFFKITFPQMKWALLYGVILVHRERWESSVRSMLCQRQEERPLHFHWKSMHYICRVQSSLLLQHLQYPRFWLFWQLLYYSFEIFWNIGQKQEGRAADMYVEMKDICKQYGSFKASDHVSFGIEKGKLVALLGPSGSGKTTLLRMIAGLEMPNSGDIYIDGKRVNDVPASKRGIGFVFQNYALFRYMTVYDNVAFGLELQKVPKKEIKKRVTELLEITGLSGMEKRYPNQLSGGQRQRVAFARALAPRPQVLLLDEPFAAIDAKVRSELRLWLRSVVTKLGITSIFVTHDQDEAVEVADEIIITNHGTIEQIGTPAEIYNTPDTPFVAQFIGRSSLVEHYEELHGFDKIEGAAKAVIRPEFVKIHKFGKIDRYMSASQDGIVKDIVFRGNRLDVTVDVGGIEIICEWPLEKESLEIGEKVSLLIYRLYVLDKERTYLCENKEMQEDDVFYI